MQRADASFSTPARFNLTRHRVRWLVELGMSRKEANRRVRRISDFGFCRLIRDLKAARLNQV
jgi:hypothetical protein